MSEPTTVFQLAKELNLKALELIEKIKPLDLKVKNHMAELSDEQVDKIKLFLNPPKAEAPVKKRTTTRKAAPKKEEDAPVAAAAPAAAKVIVKTTRAPIVAPTSSVIRRKAASAEPEVVAEAPMETAEAAPTTDDAAPAYETPVMESDAEAPMAAAEADMAAGTEAAPVEVAPTAEGAAPPAPEAAAAARRGPRFSVIRVVSPEPAVRSKPLIVEEAPANATFVYGRRSPAPRTGAAIPKTFSDPELARSGSSLIRQAEEEESRKKKAAGAPRRDDEQMFKSTDYLRRERVYQTKKKRLSLGMSQRRNELTTAAAHKRIVWFDSTITVEDLADQLAVKAYELVKKLRGLGVTQPDESEGVADWYLDLATTQLVVAEYEYEVRDETFHEDAILEKARAVTESEENMEPRPAVVTIMGHVDHGKTSLLDVIRRARVAEGEAGGITQHIGAYTVTVGDAVKNLTAKKEGGGKKDKKDKKEAKAAKGAKAKGGNAKTSDQLTFLDTPGHAAFTSMRARGASVTDIVVLVVSATDGVMPQTREAIEHAKAAEAPLIVAVNKMDLPEANPDRIRQQLSEMSVISEEWGGDTIFVPVSAKTGDGVDKLLEMIQLQAELLELKARFDGAAEGTLIEAKLDKGRGPVASVLIKAGKLKVGDTVVAGVHTGKVRALVDDKGQQVREAGPSMPVEILGLGGVPEAGDTLSAVVDEKAAKEVAEYRAEQKKAENLSGGASLEALYARMSAGDVKELPIIVKADVKGSAEAIQFALQKLPMDKVRLKILTAGVGGISESDVLLASASKAVIFGFNVRADAKSQADAERRGVQIKNYSIIYDLIDEVTKAMAGMLAPITKETIMGRAEVRNVFTISKVGAVAGSSVIKGKIQRSNQVRLIRDNRVVYTGKLSGLKRFKDDAREVAEGFECGISIEGYNDIKAGDIVEAYSVESIAATLDGPSANA